MRVIDTREKVLGVADGHFAQVGCDAATTREIAEISGANKVLIRYHFENKEALPGSILDRYDELAAAPAKSPEAEGTVLERTKRLIDACVDFSSENRNLARTVQREASGGKHIERIRRDDGLCTRVHHQ